MEAQLGLRSVEIQLQRTADDYSDERADKTLDFVAKKSRLETDLHDEKKRKQMERLAGLQSLRDQREGAAHQREMALKQQELQHELDKTSMYAGMTFEQIMAINPNISAEAAKALAEKFKGDKDRELLEKREEDKTAEMKRMQDMMDRMQQMAEATMKQTAVIATGQVAHAKSAGEDVVSVVESTLKASGQVFSADARAKGPKQQNAGGSGKQVKVRYCKNCEAELDADSSFCPECGEKVE
jgi:hypothetical protein